MIRGQSSPDVEMTFEVLIKKLASLVNAVSYLAK